MNFLLLQKNNDKIKRLTFVVIAFLIVTLADVLFFRELLGVNVLVITLAYLFGFGAIAFITKHVHNKKFLLLAVPIVLLSLTPALYANTLVQSLGLIVLGFSLVVYSLLITLKNPDKHPVIFKNIPILENMFEFFNKVDILFKDVFVWEKGKNAQKIVKKIFLGFGISIPILFIFILLLSSADEVFKEYFVNFINIFSNLSVVAHIIRILVGTIIISTFWYVFIDKNHKINYKETKVKKFDNIIMGIILGLVNILFLMFIFIQIKYLFAGSPLDLELTFAEYARHGFFELVKVILLSATLHLIIFRSTSKHRTSIIVNVFQVGLILQVGVIAYSALIRMNMYQEAYGFTVERLYVEWLIYGIMGLLLFSGVALLTKLSFQKFFSYSLILVFCGFVGVSLMNVDYLVAKENVRRVVEDGESLDIFYLSKLSSDAAPALLPLFNDEDLVLKVNNDYLSKIRSKPSIRGLVGLMDFYIKDIESRSSWTSWYYGKVSLQESKDVVERFKQKE